MTGVDAKQPWWRWLACAIGWHSSPRHHATYRSHNGSPIVVWHCSACGTYTCEPQ